MSNFNSQYNRVVWCDVPVADLDRACSFYAAVLDLPVHQEQMEGFRFAVLHHSEGNGGCLIPHADQVSPDRGVLVYFNVDGRIRDAVVKVAEYGGQVIEPVHSIGPHGYRALVLDSEGNRIALHSNTDA